jgi:uncharacterized protein (DUF3820 family)
MTDILTQTVSFGKHKGKPMADLLADTKYLEWLMNQPEKRGQVAAIYNIFVLKQSGDSSKRDAPTPQHNKLQNKFLEQKYVSALEFLTLFPKNHRVGYEQSVTKHIAAAETEEAKAAYRALLTLYEHAKLDKTWGDTKANLEAEYNWDVKINTDDPVRGFDDIPEDIKAAARTLGITKKSFGSITIEVDKSGEVSIFLESRSQESRKYMKDMWYNILCEIKPQLGDDYPCVLRKMKEQIAKSEIAVKRENHEMEEDLKKMGYYDRKGLGRSETRNKYVLLLGAFQAESATTEQLKEIFRRDDITVLFVSDLEAAVTE